MIQGLVLRSRGPLESSGPAGLAVARTPCKAVRVADTLGAARAAQSLSRLEWPALLSPLPPPSRYELMPSLSSGTFFPLQRIEQQ